MQRVQITRGHKQQRQGLYFLHLQEGNSYGGRVEQAMRGSNKRISISITNLLHQVSRTQRDDRANTVRRGAVFDKRIEHRLADLRRCRIAEQQAPQWRSEEHTSELQSRFDLVCR